MLKVGIIGCGAIGTVLARAICRGEAGSAELVAIYDANPEKAEKLGRGLGNVPIAGSISELLGKKVGLVVEAASQDAVREYGELVLKSGKHLMVMSVGALLDDALAARLMKAAEEAKAGIYVPSGAVLAIDALKAANIGKLKSVELTTRKPPESLGIKEKLTCEKVVYSGNAEEAVRKYPQNINVAATISLAGIGKEKTRVVIIADPAAKRNIHELAAEGDFGRFVARIENVPSPMNPKTSHIAALSAIRLIRNFTETLKIGT